MAESQIPVVGESFKPYVNGQIVARQKIYGSGFTQTRTAQEMSYLNSNVPWIKLASSVSILEDDDGRNRLKKLGLSGDSEKGTSLAKKGVLFNGLTPLSGNMKSGVAQSNSLINNSAYGFGGTEFGLKPLPGIISMDVAPINRGSIKQATVNIKAYNKFQFELIETLYLRLGYTIMLEWGNSIYVDNNNQVQTQQSSLIDTLFFGESKTSPSTPLGVLNEIEKQRDKTKGNYDALFAKVVNFDWTYQPDGSYDISIKLSSLGDVVESFKVNILTSSTTLNDSYSKEDSKNNGGEISNDEVNKNSISNFFYATRTEWDIPNYKDLYKGDIIQINNNNAGENDRIKIDDSFYIRLGYLLSYIQTHLVIHSDCGSPIFFTNTSDDCVMATKPKMLSVDPRVCIILPNFGKDGLDLIKSPDETPSWAKELLQHHTCDNIGDKAYIHNTYLNFSFVNKTLESNIDKKGDLSYYSFITALLNGINRSLSNVCDLEVTVNEEKNEVIIRDQNLPTRQLKDKVLTDLSEEIIVTGFDNNQSNFVKNFSFKTQITSKLSTMLSIGAAANGDAVNEDATAFEKWNSGLNDRFNKTLTYGLPKGCKKEKPKPKPTSKPKEEGSWYDWIFKDSPKTEKLKELRDLYNTNIKRYFEAAFNKTSQTAVASENTRDSDGVKKKLFLGLKYFQMDPDFIEKGKRFMKNYVNGENKSKLKIKYQPSSNIGFIPLELTLDIVGMSGIKIYNQLLINTKFLPYNYGNTLEFVVMGLNHKVDSSGWVTSINAISKPKDNGRNPMYSDVYGPLDEGVQRTPKEIKPKIDFSPNIN